MSKILLIMIVMLALAGCGKSRELEKRDYVMAIAIDDKEGYNVSTAVAKPTGGSDSNPNEEIVFSGKGDTIDDAVSDINNRTKGQLYMGHNRVIILSGDFNDYKGLIDYFSNNVEMSRDTIIVKSNNPSKIISAKNNEDSASRYIYNYFENKKKVDMDRLMDYYNKGEEIILPEAVIENENVIIKWYKIMKLKTVKFR